MKSIKRSSRKKRSYRKSSNVDLKRITDFGAAEKLAAGGVG